MPLVPDAIRVRRSAVGFDARTLVRISAMAFGHPWRLGLAIVATVLAASAQLIIPQLIGDAVDQARGLLAAGAVEETTARAALTTTALLLLATAVFRGFCTMMQNYQGEAVGQIIGYELRLAYYAKLQRLSFSYHDRMHTGDLMTRGMLDIEGTRLWVDTGILRLILLSILIFGGLAILISIDGFMAWVAMAFVPFVGLGAAIARLRLRTLWYALQEELGVLTRVMEENLGGIRVVRAFTSQAFEMARFDVISKRALAIAHKRITVFVASTASMTFVFFLTMGAVLWLGGERVAEGKLSVGELATFLAFMTILQQPVRQIAWMVNSIARASTCGSRLFEILDLEPAIADAPNAIALPSNSTATLRFEGVRFAYAADANDAMPPALEDISFEVTPGKTLGIVGPPGSGKSTVANLIPRYYDVSGGRVTIDGHDIRDVTLDSLRRIVSVVQQDAFLFTSAIETNIAYGDPNADRSTIRRATDSAQLHRYVEQLPEGYETLVGERGVSLSGGQRQRLAIARSVLPHSRIIVFDDSTAAIDAGTERDIRDALATLNKDRGTIIIAHRLSSLMHADEIIFLDKGRIVERGSHEQLIAKNGQYAALHALQTRADEKAP